MKRLLSVLVLLCCAMPLWADDDDPPIPQPVTSPIGLWGYKISTGERFTIDPLVGYDYQPDFAAGGGKLIYDGLVDGFTCSDPGQWLSLATDPAISKTYTYDLETRTRSLLCDGYSYYLSACPDSYTGAVSDNNGGYGSLKWYHGGTVTTMTQHPVAVAQSPSLLAWSDRDTSTSHVMNKTTGETVELPQLASRLSVIGNKIAYGVGGVHGFYVYDVETTNTQFFPTATFGFVGFGGDNVLYTTSYPYDLTLHNLTTGLDTVVYDGTAEEVPLDACINEDGTYVAFALAKYGVSIYDAPIMLYDVANGSLTQIAGGVNSGVAYTAITGDYVIYDPVAIPEPSTVVLLIPAFAAFFFVKRLL